jgi:hypothetical protein
LDLRSAQVGTERRGDDLAVQFPSSRPGVAGHEPEEVLLPLAPLNSDMNVAMTVGIVGTGAATEARQLRPLDSNQHEGIIAPGRPV